MNKEEILAKAQKENKFGDEREQQIVLKSYERAFDFSLILCTLLYVLSGKPEFYLVYFWMRAIQTGYMAWKLRKKRDIVFAALYTLSSIALLVIYFSVYLER